MAAYVIGLPYGPSGAALAFSTAMTTFVRAAFNVVLAWHGDPSERPDLGGYAPVVATAAAAGLAYGAQGYSTGLSSTFLTNSVMLTAYFGILMFVLGRNRFYVHLLRRLLKPPPNRTKG